MDSEQEGEFAEFVVTRTERLRRFAYLCCADWQRAEDAVQTALVRLYGTWNRARRTSPEGYVQRIIVNLLIDEHRLVWFRRVRVTDSAPERATVDVNGRTDDRLVLTQALLRLPARQRAAVVLRFWEDLPIEETSLILGCSTGAVKNLTMRGLATLRDLLADEAVIPVEGVQS